MRKVVGLVAVVGMAIVLLAPPGVVVAGVAGDVRGSADVGTGPLGIDGLAGTEDAVPASGVCPPDRSRGLRAPVNLGPGIDPEIPTSRRGFYHFTGDVRLGVVGLVPATLAPMRLAVDICGMVEPAEAGMGAACGLSSGGGGRGVAVAPNGWRLELFGVGWDPTAGVLRTVRGHIRLPGGGNGSEPPEGTFSARVAVIPQPLLDCLHPAGAATSIVAGRVLGGVISLPL